MNKYLTTLIVTRRCLLYSMSSQTFWNDDASFKSFQSIKRVAHPFTGIINQRIAGKRFPVCKHMTKQPWAYVCPLAQNTIYTVVYMYSKAYTSDEMRYVYYHQWYGLIIDIWRFIWILNNQSFVCLQPLQSLFPQPSTMTGSSNTYPLLKYFTQRLWKFWLTSNNRIWLVDDRRSTKLDYKPLRNWKLQRCTNSSRVKWSFQGLLSHPLSCSGSSSSLFSMFRFGGGLCSVPQLKRDT